MRLLNTENRTTGGKTVTSSLTSNWLESRMTRKRACPVRGRAVGKVPQGYSLAAYPTGPLSPILAESFRLTFCGHVTVRVRSQGVSKPTHA
jgi:hypothetical protein